MTPLQRLRELVTIYGDAYPDSRSAFEDALVSVEELVSRLASRKEIGELVSDQENCHTCGHDEGDHEDQLGACAICHCSQFALKPDPPPQSATPHLDTELDELQRRSELRIANPRRLDWGDTMKPFVMACGLLVTFLASWFVWTAPGGSPLFALGVALAGCFVTTRAVLPPTPKEMK